MKGASGFAFFFAFAAAMSAIPLTAAGNAVQMPSAADVAPTPSPTAALAPIDEQPPPVQATSTPKVLGHEIVSAFCTAFVARFNVAATTMLADDNLLDDATAAETDYENDYFRLDGATRSWDHRLAMIAALSQIMRTIPKTQAAVNDLRAQAAASTDAERRAALAEGALQLQTSLDHQRIVANELNDAVDATLDLHTIEDTIGRQPHVPDGPPRVSIDAGDAPVPHPGDGLPQARSAGTYYASAIEFYMHMPRDRQLGANAESNAAAAATRIVRSCALETQTRP